MLRYSADIRTLGFVTTFFALVAVGWVWHPEELWLRVPLVVACCLFSFFCAVITHNTVHVPIFKSRGLNRLFQIVLTFAYGHPVSAYVPGHNLSHHVHVQTRKDVMRTSKLRFRWNLLNQLFFLTRVSGAIVRAEYLYAKAMRTERPRWFRQLVIESVLFVGVMIALGVVDWQRWLLYVVVPYQYAAWGIVGINYVQHDGCDATHPYNHSRNFVGKLVNWWTFNNGYHGMHHEKAGLHWSKLPEAHRKHLSPHIHPALEQTSLLRYLFQAYVWPGKRVDYLGHPVVLPDEGPDEDWIPGVGETPMDVSLGAEA